MAGIYIHIPFCKQACHYCDFHFSTNLSRKTEMIESIVKEIKLRKEFLSKQKVETIYFGGGTPSLLDEVEINYILGTIKTHFDVSEYPEVTLEANPDDLNEDSLKMFMDAGVNRLSIGIQTFDDGYLAFFNRAHDSAMASNCVPLARKVGFKNISIDLIFGIPNQTVDQLKSDLAQAISLDTEHISIYGLTIEKDTVFGRRLAKGKLSLQDEELAATQLELIMDELTQHGFEQYEISNFCKPSFESRHNRSYWQGKYYLGIGPGAHSFNGDSRLSNVANNSKYIQQMQAGNVQLEEEQLSVSDKINEYILTRIRTTGGIDINELFEVYGFDITNLRSSMLHDFEKTGLINQKTHSIVLTDKGKLLADYITEKLMV